MPGNIHYALSMSSHFPVFYPSYHLFRSADLYSTLTNAVRYAVRLQHHAKSNLCQLGIRFLGPQLNFAFHTAEGHELSYLRQ